MTVKHGRSAPRHVVRLERLPPSPEEVERGLSLSRSDRVLVQQGLASLGLDVGFADGVFGLRTRAAIRSYQRTKGLAETGYLTREVFEALAALGKEAQARPKWPEGKKFRDCAECPEMVVIPAGSYQMGSLLDDSWRYDDEGPVHRVTISAPFAVGKYEVTFSEWDACRGDGGCSRNPDDEGWGRGDRPVVDVSWEDAQEYVRWLSAETGGEYRLLSESEWEYVARGGSSTSRYWGGSERGQCLHANGADRSAERSYSDWTVASCDDGYVRTSPVGSFRANGFGLHDVSGNVLEWVEDCWHDSYVGAPSDGGAWTSGVRVRPACVAWRIVGQPSEAPAFRVSRHVLHRKPELLRRFSRIQDAGLSLASLPLVRGARGRSPISANLISGPRLNATESSMLLARRPDEGEEIVRIAGRTDSSAPVSAIGAPRNMPQATKLALMGRSPLADFRDRGTVARIPARHRVGGPVRSGSARG